MDAKLQGMWENAPIQATDLTKVKWVDCRQGNNLRGPVLSDISPKEGDWQLQRLAKTLRPADLP
jgi:hypothetical protein